MIIRRFKEYPIAVDSDSAISDVDAALGFATCNARSRGLCARPRPKHGRAA